ncbi:hypothetical protein [Natrinema sp. SYSU A 869]|uniref:hypothetical protein n=1 Tax=Natrinema sp. SYSU A 869 TaxID=2871694 RepID=UPI001CA434CA|nr:hypothetical protein [Natrinema sp. SYSU A 869]
MDRRTFVAVAGTILGAGCSGLPLSTSNETQSLGDTVSYGSVDVTVTDAMRTGQVTIVGTSMDDSKTVTHPSDSVYALFWVEARNTDETSRDGPTINPSNYDALEDGPDVVTTTGLNDIRVDGSGDSGYFPSVGMGLGMAVDNGRYALRVGDRDFETYPAGKSRPSIDANETISGWVIGTIGAEETPQVTITYNGTSAMWTTGPSEVSTVTPPENASNETVQGNATTETNSSREFQ